MKRGARPRRPHAQSESIAPETETSFELPRGRSRWAPEAGGGSLHGPIRTPPDPYHCASSSANGSLLVEATL
eukprot:15478795-Alexandrium_andersonii.AAC.1